MIIAVELFLFGGVNAFRFIHSSGEFRISQNWFGGQSSMFKNAQCIPLNVKDMKDIMLNLEKYMNIDDNIDVLIYYQFEIIHPFLDGGGRIGRLLGSTCLLGC